MDEQSYNAGRSVCYICKHHADINVSIFLGGPFHIHCLNNLGEGWIKCIFPNPNAQELLDWLSLNWEGNVEYIVLPNGKVEVIDLNEEQIEGSFVIDEVNSESSASFVFLDSASSISQSGISEGSVTGSSNEAGSEGTESEENGSETGESNEDQESVITINSSEIVVPGILDGPEPDYRFPGACWKCGEIADANNGGLHFVGPWHIRCLDLMGVGWRNLIGNGPDFLDWVNESWNANEAASVQRVRDAVERWRRDLETEGAEREGDEAEGAHAAKRARRE